jgi:hypothetical protein
MVKEICDYSAKADKGKIEIKKIKKRKKRK